MEDIDDLLDDAELVANSTKERSEKTVINFNNTKSRNQVKKIDDMRDLMDEIDEVLADKSEERRLSNQTHIKGTLSGGKRYFPGELKEKDNQQWKKCAQVYVGGSNSSLGLSTVISIRACDALMCTKCDLRVIHFENMSWTTVDYLFLRNNYPDRKKLVQSLQGRTGIRSYCCQCTFTSAADVKPVNHVSTSWMCSKHKTVK